ncbi:MAG: AAA family ATPase [Alphaproteobacteria bacterium]|nr:AAA family ATPase [Alphaproteobacteria bacterium]
MEKYPLTNEELLKLSPEDRLEYHIFHELAALGLDNFKAKALERINAMGGLTPEQRAKFSSDEYLNSAFESVKAAQKQNEEKIIDLAVKKLESTVKSPGRRKKRETASTIGEKVAAGPDLVILDGGPGAGKSFGLNVTAQALGLDEQREGIFCAGATATAGKDLRDDMTRKVKEEEVTEERKKDDIISKPQGMYSIKEMMTKGTEGWNAWQEAKKQNPPVILIVDEAGLLDDEELCWVLNEAPGRVILAGDCRQIPPAKGNQPFALLVESMRDTPAYVNAPYVYRQGLLAEKAITSGIYNGQNNSMEENCSINTELANDFLKEAINAGKGSGIKFEYTTKNGEIGGLSEYIEETYTVDNADKDKYPDKTEKEIKLMKFIADLAKEAETMHKKDLNSIIEEGQKSELNTYSKDEAKAAGKEEGDSKEPITDPKKMTRYLAAVMVCQKMGACAYDALGRVEEVEPQVKGVSAKQLADAEAQVETFYETVAHKYAQTDISKTAQDIETAFKELKDLREQNADPEKIEKAEGKLAGLTGKGFKKGPLAITVTEKEAEDFNKAVRAERYGKKEGDEPEPLHVGEPIIFKDGTKRLATPADVEAAQKNGGMPKDCKFAYALDAKSTQGLSHSGPVEMLVRKETQALWQGGEILVGASRHKGTAKFKILFESGVDKAAFYEQSTYQFIEERNISAAQDERLKKAAKESLIPTDQNSAKSSSRKTVNFKINKVYTQAAQENPQVASLTSRISAFGNNNNKILNDKIIQQKIDNTYGK